MYYVYSDRKNSRIDQVFYGEILENNFIISDCISDTIDYISFLYEFFYDGLKLKLFLDILRIGNNFDYTIYNITGNLKDIRFFLYIEDNKIFVKIENVGNNNIFYKKKVVNIF